MFASTLNARLRCRSNDRDDAQGQLSAMCTLLMYRGLNLRAATRYTVYNLLVCLIVDIF